MLFCNAYISVLLCTAVPFVLLIAVTFGVSASLYSKVQSSHKAGSPLTIARN